MKKLALITAIAAFSFNATAASTNYKFVGQDESSATNLCVVAATQGYTAAKRIGRIEQGLVDVEFDTITCNGQRIRTFAKSFEAVTVSAEQTEPEKEYQFKLVDSTEATQICALAAEKGLQTAIVRGGQKVTSYSCNGLPIRTFARRYAN
jgi:hypothetical protein